MSIDPNTLEKIKKACSPQKAIYEIADFVSTDILPDVENATNTANAALGQANSAYNRATEALGRANSAYNRAAEASIGVSRMEPQVEDSVIELTDSVNGSTVTIVGNKNSGASTKVILPVSSRLQAGVMNSATYATLDELGNRVTALESNTVTYLVTLPNDNPTQAEINSTYQTAYPTAPFPPNDGTTVIDQGKQLFYRYVKNGNLWIKTTGFTISQWTNDTLGTVKGSTTPGQIQAETDGTGSLVGYDAMVANIASNTNAIRDHQESIDDIYRAIENTVGNIFITPTATEYTITVATLNGDAVTETINPVNSHYAGIVTPTMFEQWNDKTLNYQTAFVENKNYLKFEIMYNDSLTELFRFEKPTSTSLSINLKTSTINPNASKLRSGFIYYGTANGNSWVNLNADNTITITDEHAFFNVVIGNLYGALGFHGCTIPIGITNPVSSTDFNQTYVFYTVPKTPYIKVTLVRQT